MAGFQGEKLRKARLYRGLTLTELAEETGVSKQALSKYEKTRMSLPQAICLRLLVL